MSAYFVYMLRCGDGSIYTGITTSPARRFAEHSGALPRGAKYTASHSPVRFEAVWKTCGRPAALSLEHRIKQLSRPEKERLISGGLTAGGLYADGQTEFTFERVDGTHSPESSETP